MIPKASKSGSISRCLEREITWFWKRDLSMRLAKSKTTFSAPPMLRPVISCRTPTFKTHLALSKLLRFWRVVRVGDLRLGQTAPEDGNSFAEAP